MFTIGEFSRLSHVSARMLRHYDRIGLLRPARVGQENGYRYYDAGQLKVLAGIERLKGYGFSLAEIAGLLRLSGDELHERIHRRRLGAYAELDALRRNLRHMEEDLADMGGIGARMEKYPVIVLESPAQRVFGIRRRINVAQTHALFQELYREMEKRGLRRGGVTQQIYHGEEFSYEDMDVEAQAEVGGEHPDVKLLPAQTCAAVTHTGPYETIRYAYDAIGAWMAEHPEYRICGPAIERYLRDEGSVESPEELETGVLFPIERVK